MAAKGGRSQFSMQVDRSHAEVCVGGGGQWRGARYSIVAALWNFRSDFFIIFVLAIKEERGRVGQIQEKVMEQLPQHPDLGPNGRQGM